MHFALSIFTGLLCWELLAHFAIIDPRFFPAPTSILAYLVFESVTDGLPKHVAVSMWRIAAGFTIGSVLGVAVGVIMGLMPRVRRIIYPWISVTYPLPKIALFPLIMLVLGLGDAPKITVIALGSFFLVLINTLQGIDGSPKIYRDLAVVYRVRYWQQVFHIVIPNAAPTIFAGLKLALGYSFVMMVASEFSGADSGLGYIIWQSWETFSIKAMYAGIFVVGVLGMVGNYILDWAERRCLPWYRPHA